MRLRLVQNHLVLLPGLDGTGQLFAHFIQSPANHFTCSVVSYPRDEALYYQQLIPRIRGVMPWDQSYTLVAESFAGPLALQFAAAQPDRIMAIVLVASFIRNPIHPLLGWTRFLVNDSWLQNPLPVKLLHKYFVGDDCPEMLSNEIMQTIKGVRPEVLAHRIRLARDTDASDLLRSCRKPILYIAAKQDKIVGRRGLEAILAIKPDVKSVELDGPHLLLQRKPVEVLTEIDQFLLEEKLINRMAPESLRLAA